MDGTDLDDVIEREVPLALTTVKAGCLRKIPRALLNSLKAEAAPWLAFEMEHMALRLSAKMLANQTESFAELTEEVPADWWQHVRQRWFPAWWLRRHPVKTRTIAVVVKTNVYRCCPHLDVPEHDDGRKFYLHYRYLDRGE